MCEWAGVKGDGTRFVPDRSGAAKKLLDDVKPVVITEPEPEVATETKGNGDHPPTSSEPSPAPATVAPTTEAPAAEPTASEPAPASNHAVDPAKLQAMRQQVIGYVLILVHFHFTCYYLHFSPISPIVVVAVRSLARSLPIR